MSRGFEELVDLEGLGPAEQARLRRVHDLLVAAGPPAELPAALVEPPGPVAEVIPLASRRRRPLVAFLLAAAVAGACFGGGYLIANGSQGGTTIVHVDSLQGQRDAFASLRIGPADANGNSPMQLSVNGLPPLASSQDKYTLMVWKDGKPTSLVGMFVVRKNGTVTVKFSAPYTISKSTRFVVTEMGPGTNFPGQVVMTSS